MARWLDICSKCGHRVEVEGNLPVAKCPGCDAVSWLCRLLDLPTTPKPAPEPSYFAQDATSTRLNGCNKTKGSIKHHVGRPRADISEPEVMQLHSDGMTLRTIASKVGISHMTVKRILSGQRALPSV